MYSQYGSPEYGENSGLKKKFFGFSPEKELFITALCIGIGFVMYPICSDIFAYALYEIPGAYDKYINDTTFGYLCEVIYSFFCVGFPFGTAWLFLKGTDKLHGEISFSKPRTGKLTLILIFAAVGVCFIGDYVTSYITSFLQSMGMDFYSYQTMLEGEPLPEGVWQFTVYVIRTAIVPALIEELCFRGLVLQTLRKYGDWFAIIISAVMFGFMHGNMTQVPFALIAGFALGYCYIVTGSLWTPIAVHFINNFIAVLYTVVCAAFNDGVGLVFSAAVSYILIFAGVICFIVYCRKNPCWRRLYPGVSPTPKKKGLVFFLSPTVIAGLIFLIRYMIADIII